MDGYNIWNHWLATNIHYLASKFHYLASKFHYLISKYDSAPSYVTVESNSVRVLLDHHGVHQAKEAFLRKCVYRRCSRWEVVSNKEFHYHWAAQAALYLWLLCEVGTISTSTSSSVAVIVTSTTCGSTDSAVTAIPSATLINTDTVTDIATVTVTAAVDLTCVPWVCPPLSAAALWGTGRPGNGTSPTNWSTPKAKQSKAKWSVEQCREVEYS